MVLVHGDLKAFQVAWIGFVRNSAISCIATIFFQLCFCDCMRFQKIFLEKNKENYIDILSSLVIYI